MVAYRRIIFFAGDAHRKLGEMAQLILTLFFERFREIASLHRRQPNQAAEAETYNAVNSKSDRKAHGLQQPELEQGLSESTALTSHRKAAVELKTHQIHSIIRRNTGI